MRLTSGNQRPNVLDLLAGLFVGAAIGILLAVGVLGKGLRDAVVGAVLGAVVTWALIALTRSSGSTKH